MQMKNMPLVIVDYFFLSEIVSKKLKQSNWFSYEFNYESVEISSKVKELKKELSTMLEEITGNTTNDERFLIDDINRLSIELFERYSKVFN